MGNLCCSDGVLVEASFEASETLYKMHIEASKIASAKARSIKQDCLFTVLLLLSRANCGDQLNLANGFEAHCC